MSKKILAAALLIMMLFAVGCKAQNQAEQPVDNSQVGESDSTQTPDSVEEKNENGEFFFRAKVIDISDDSIGAEIIDSNVAFGYYRVLTGEQTEYFDESGSAVTKADIQVGDTIEIIFSGQVMTSLPPQIAALKIYLI